MGGYLEILHYFESLRMALMLSLPQGNTAKSSKHCQSEFLLCLLALPVLLSECPALAFESRHQQKF